MKIAHVVIGLDWSRSFFHLSSSWTPFPLDYRLGNLLLFIKMILFMDYD